MLCGSSGCVVADPPEYGQTEKIPPVLITSQAVPPITEVLYVQPQDQRQFSVPFRSEDAGEQVYGVAWLNYSFPEREQLEFFRVVPPGTFDEVRTITFTWVPRDLGCQQLSLLVMHQSDLNTETNKPVNTADFALATWWANVGSGDPEPLVDCPSQSGGSQ